MVDGFPASLQDYLNLQRVTREFGLRMQSCRRMGGRVMIETDAGRAEVRLLRSGPVEYGFACGAAEFLRGQGFTRLPEIFWTPAGQAHVMVNGALYSMRRWVPGRPADLGDPRQMDQAVEMLAWFHRCAIGYRPAGETAVRVEWGSWPRRFTAILERLRQYEERARAESEHDRFARLFLRLSAEQISLASGCLAALAKGPYEMVVAGERERGGLRHGGYLGSNMIRRDDGALFLDDLEDLAQETRLDDLGRFLAEHGRWEPQRLLSIIETYNGIAPLDREDLTCLRVYLSFPIELLQAVEAHVQGAARAEQDLKRFASGLAQRAAAIERLKEAPVGREEFFGARLRGEPVAEEPAAAPEPWPPFAEQSPAGLDGLDGAEPLERRAGEEIKTEETAPAAGIVAEEAPLPEPETVATEAASMPEPEATEPETASLPGPEVAVPDVAEDTAAIVAEPAFPAEAATPVGVEIAGPAHLVWRPFPPPLKAGGKGE